MSIFVVVLVTALASCIPVSAASPANNDQIPGLTEAPVHNVTNASFTNTTILSQYPVTPAPVKIGVEYEETIPGVKGEMGVSPRTIGFSLSPVALIVVLAAVVVVVAGISWFVWQKRTKKDK
ncbi:MAG: hypothetical protein WC391_06560 [Methanoregula sp.]